MIIVVGADAQVRNELCRSPLALELLSTSGASSKHGQHALAIVFGVRSNSSDIEDSRANVDVRNEGRQSRSSLNARSSSKEWNVDIALVRVLFAAANAPLAKLVAMVRGKEYVRVVQNSSCFKVIKDKVNHVVNADNSAPSVPEVVINPCLSLGVQWWVLGDVTGFIGLSNTCVVRWSTRRTKVRE